MKKRSKKDTGNKLVVAVLASGLLLSSTNLYVSASETISTDQIQQKEGFVKAANTVPKLVNAESIDAVINAMTLQEKAFLLVGGNKGGLTSENGEIIGGQSTKVPGAAGQTQAIPRLGIPAIVLADGPMGVRISPTRENDAKTYYATKFPSPTVLASTWDADLVKEVGDATSEEMKAYGIDLLLAPGMNIQSYLLNGRNFEYFSEDPIVTGKLATAFVNGVEENGVGTTIKHFAAFNQRTNNNGNMIVSQRALREIYLKGFEMTVKEAKPWSIMDSYNKINGTYATENKELLTDVLRNDFGFTGFAMTDWEFADRDIVKQMEAGTNLLMPGRAAQSEAIIAAVESGLLDEKILDRNVKEILQIVVQSPTFKGAEPTNSPDLAAGAKVARTAAAQGMVLLQNKNQALPIKNNVSASLFGVPVSEINTGGRGSALVYAPYQLGIAEGLRTAGLTLNESLLTKYDQYAADLRSQDAYKGTPGTFGSVGPKLPEMDITEDVQTAAANTDIGIVVIGTAPGSYAVDRAKEDFYLSPSQKEMVEKVSKAYRDQGKKVIAVLNVEGPVEVESWKEKVDGILLSWQPGQELGNAVADVLTGKVNPSGKLAQTFPVDYTDLPYADRYPGSPDGFPYEEDIYVGYRYNTTFNVKPSYEFGYGLSYTTFEYDKVKATKKFKNTLSISTAVKNTGKVPGREVVQVYVSAPDGKLEKPSLELKAFAKTAELKPGKKEKVTFELGAKDLASFSEELSAWVLEKGTYTIQVGASSEDIKDTATFTVAEDIIVEKVSDVLEPGTAIERLSKR
ncbi:glycoside hydrolase family 3 C-terminal domain-containing protein [Domibacillus indicus]|uniref:beta-glucosidase n=1 Tax=Domibacillus indicus TaxID=1437523 RepID=UPI002041A9E2|nr:glycoside hydrolase family 3 N-terminal domain-containing protein [Domibacillus indicus]MCM3789701.1 glycoside hydrolase family 3 C-terminal domain-containing protein [Domibacillus indicus]